MPAPLAFHVLGPLQVTQADAPVVLGGPRERVLLAALLVEHGRVVSVDVLTQALWGDRPPATARHQVAIGVSRLRKAFAAAGAGPEVIATCAPGYLVAGGWLDARCFEEHARQARDALAAGDREEAARQLRAGHRALLRDEPAGHLGEPAWHQDAPPRPQGGPAPWQDQAGRVQPGPPVPAQLPPDVRGFTGRHAELAALDELAAAS